MNGIRKCNLKNPDKVAHGSKKRKYTLGLIRAALYVRFALKNRVPHEWIGRAGPVLWPPWSPALTPTGFLF